VGGAHLGWYLGATFVAHDARQRHQQRRLSGALLRAAPAREGRGGGACWRGAQTDGTARGWCVLSMRDAWAATRMHPRPRHHALVLCLKVHDALCTVEHGAVHAQPSAGVALDRLDEVPSLLAWQSTGEQPRAAGCRGMNTQNYRQCLPCRSLRPLWPAALTP
jgi:hypothetical protein